MSHSTPDVVATSGATLESLLDQIGGLAQAGMPPEIYDPFFVGFLDAIENQLPQLELYLSQGDGGAETLWMVLGAQLNAIEELFAADASAQLDAFQALRAELPAAFEGFVFDESGLVVDVGGGGSGGSGSQDDSGGPDDSGGSGGSSDAPLPFFDDFDDSAFEDALQALVDSGQLGAPRILAFFQAQGNLVDELTNQILLGGSLADASSQDLLDSWVALGDAFAALLPQGSTARTLYEGFLSDLDSVAGQLASPPPAFNTDDGFLFEQGFYLLSNADLAGAVAPQGAFQHYLQVGAAEGRAPNPWFDADYYGARWPDLAALNLDAATLFQHYNLYGVWEGRSGGPAFDLFDGERYLEDNPDVAAYVDAFIDDFLGSRTNGAIAHYVIYGQDEQRPVYDTTGAPIDVGWVI